MVLGFVSSPSSHLLLRVSQLSPACTSDKTLNVQSGCSVGFAWTSQIPTISHIPLFNGSKLPLSVFGRSLYIFSPSTIFSTPVGALYIPRNVYLGPYY